MVPCPACKLFHHPMMNCRVAENQLWSGTLPEPWLSANRLEELKARKAVAQESASVKPEPGRQPEHAPVAMAPKKVVKGVGRPRVYADPDARRKERQRAYMKAWRKKK